MRAGAWVVSTWMAAGLLCPALARADGGEVNGAGEGKVYLGYSIKRGVDRFDEDGDQFRARNGRTHDFRYTYLYFEVGVLERLQVQGTLTYLSGCESFDPGTSESFCHYGPSDQWIGLKYQLPGPESWPLAVEATARLPEAYMNDDEVTGSGKHWLGIYRHDYSLILHTSHGFGSRLWAAFAGGYVYREGAPADVLSLRPEASVYLGRIGPGALTLTASIDAYLSLGNEEPAHPERDRFGNRREELPGHYFDFNDARYIRPALGLSYAFGSRWSAGLGYSRTVGGRSAHIYDEGWLAVGISF